MSATSAAAAGCDQYPRLSSLGTRRARRNIPTVASHRKEVKKKEGRRTRAGEGEKSRRILRVCGNRTSPKTLAPSFSASFPPPFFLSRKPCRPRNERGREGNHVAGTPTNIEWADGQRRERESTARALLCVHSPSEARHDTYAHTRRRARRACVRWLRLCAPSCTHVQQASVTV